ncbi:two-component sensor histidine kinase [Dactylosporangium aurantiacum]|uniref:histidine kinase n=1 Tax=Dactylosporangium aurantiacum TaxID=35754 RepID=A0A9Q9ID98_9ACTN|nr:histidine kinase [Dactylosporangium aurantiacum]MDG6101863.1 histidine kinase [Dactylosporangium aurantiacum]UWZ52338.1 two-component sensor histidine kinase [Dactylosporangium aurantiacum]
MSGPPPRPATGAPRRFRGLPPDAALLPLLCGLDLFTASSVVVRSHPVHPVALALQILAAVAAFAALAWRHRAPVAVLAVECGHGVAMWFLLHDYRPWVALVVALYTVAARRPLAVSGAAYAGACARGLFSAVDSFRVEPVPAARTGEFVVTAVMFVLLFGSAWAAGLVVRAHHARVAQLERAQRAARTEAVTLERQRIAAELHDVVSHSVTVMVLQAAGASRLGAADADRVHQSLLHIQQAGQQAMAELRRLLEVIRVDGPAGRPPLGPQPSLKDVEVLLASMRQAGLAVTTSTSGVPRRLDASVGLAAYRTVQESLTNTLKHAGPGARVAVRFTWEPHVLLLRVDDDGGALTGRPPGPVTAGLSGGHGLASLAERVRRVGGRLEAGPGPTGGYRVSACYPVPHHLDAAGCPEDAPGPQSDS